MSKKRCFITGCAGFIGFHLAKALSLRGDDVIGLDNFNHYYDVSLKRERSKNLEAWGVKVIEGDICNSHFLEQAVQEHQTTHLIHLAAQAGVRYSLTNPLAYVEANIKGFTEILELVRRNPHIKLTYASSSSVYGTNTKIPYSIKDPTEQQASFYGVTKKANELMAANYHKLYGISATGLRYFTVYGPWGRPDMALYSFTESILKEKPIDIYGFGKMSRDFTYIDDIIRGTIAAIDRGGKNELFNLGNNKPVTLLRFVEILEEALGKKAQRNLLPMPPGDVPSTYADISESMEKLQFSPKINLEEGILHFVKWFRDYKSSFSKKQN